MCAFFFFFFTEGKREPKKVSKRRDNIIKHINRLDILLWQGERDGLKRVVKSGRQTKHVMSELAFSLL